jgi:hypothetical protein
VIDDYDDLQVSATEKCIFLGAIVSWSYMDYRSVDIRKAIANLIDLNCRDNAL